MAADPEALNDSGTAGVQDVDETAADRDARRELTPGGDDLPALEPVAVDLERRHRVAARVDGDQDPVARVVDERALRGEAVGLGARRGDAAVSARRVGARLRERSVAGAVVDDDPVPAHLVRLDEDDGSAPSVAVPVATAVAVVRRRRLGARERRDRSHEHEQCELPHGSSLRFITGGVAGPRA
jgi:hypothetical protein